MGREMRSEGWEEPEVHELTSSPSVVMQVPSANVLAR